MHLLYKILLLFNFLFCVQTYADNLLPRKVNIQQGLTSNTVNKVFTDKSKLTWIGTSTGTFLYKNGNLFPFLYENKNRIQNCTDILEESKDNMWFSTFGLGIFNLNLGTLKQFTTKQGLINDKVKKIYFKNEFIYIGTQDGISIYNTETKQFLNPKFNHFKKYKEFTVIDFIEINNQVYFITQNDGTFKILNENNKPRIIKIRNHEYANSIFSWNNNIYLAEKNKILVFSVFDFINNTSNFYSILIDNVADFAVDGDQLLAVSQKLYFNNGGIFIIQKDNSYSEYKTYPSLLTQSFNSIIVNFKEQISYVGTQNDGFLIFDLNQRKRFYYSEGNVVQDIKSYKNQILFVFNSAIELKTKMGTINHHISANKMQELLAHQIAVPKDILFYNAEVYNDSIYIKANIGKIVVNNNLTKARFISSHDEPLLEHKNKLYEFHNHYSYNTDLEFIGNLYKDQPNKLPQLLLQALNFNSEIIVSTKNYGLYLIKDKLTIPLSNISDFKENQIKHIKKNINNKLLVVTNYNEIYELDPLRNYKVSFKFSDKRLKGKNIYFIDSYRNYHVIGTEVGIEFLSKDKHFILGKDYGLTMPDNITTNIIGNTLYVGGNGGYFEFDIDNFLAYRNKVNSISITSIHTVKNNEIIEYDLRTIKNNILYLSSSDVPVTIKFLPNTNVNTESLSIRYKTNPESGWSNYSNETTVQILSLLISQYDIKVEIIDNITQQSYEFDLIKIKVHNHKIWYTLTLILLVVLAIVVYIIKREQRKNKHIIVNDVKETNNIHNQSEIKNDDLQFFQDDSDISIETKMLLQSMNSHFIFNILNYYQYLILEVKTKEALKYSAHFSKFIRFILKNASTKYVNIENEIDFIKSYIDLEKYRYGFTLNLEFEIDEKIDITELYIPSFILQPISETIINYAFSDEIDLHNLKIEIKEVNAECIEIIYLYSGKNLVEIDLNKENRFNKGLLLLKAYLNKLDLKDECVNYSTEGNVNKISFLIYA